MQGKVPMSYSIKRGKGPAPINSEYQVDQSFENKMDIVGSNRETDECITVDNEV